MNQPFGFAAPGGDDDRDDSAHGRDKGNGGGTGSHGSGSGSNSGSGGAGDQNPGGQNPGGQNPGDAFGFGFGFPGAAGMGGAGGPGGAAGGMGDLGQILNQFGQMLGSMGSAMSSPESGPVNYDLAEKVAFSRLGRDTHVPESQQSAVVESVRLAELWLDDTTDFPAAANRTEAWTPRRWVEQSLPAWKEVCTPLAEQINGATRDSMPEQARQMAGPLLDMLDKMGGMGFGMQLGQGLAALAPAILFSSEIGIPFAPSGTAALLPKAVAEFASDLELPAQEVMVFLAAREAAHVRLYEHAPWLRARMISSIEEYARGVRIDNSAMDDLASRLGGDFDMSMLGDPEKMQELFGSGDIGPKITNVNEAARERLETMLALVEGWVDVLVSAAIGDRLPAADALRETWLRRRATGGAAEKTFSEMVGLELRPRMAREAATMWQRITDTVGRAERDRLWSHPDLLPDAADIANPAAVIDRILAADEEADRATSPDDDSDPFDEIEEFLRQQAEGGTSAAGPAGGEPDSNADADSTDDAHDAGGADDPDETGK